MIVKLQFYVREWVYRKQHNVIFNEDKRFGLRAVEKQQATGRRRSGMDEVWRGLYPFKARE